MTHLYYDYIGLDMRKFKGGGGGAPAPAAPAPGPTAAQQQAQAEEAAQKTGRIRRGRQTQKKTILAGNIQEDATVGKRILGS